MRAGSQLPERERDFTGMTMRLPKSLEVIRRLENLVECTWDSSVSCGATGVPEKFNWRGNLIPDA